MFTLSSVHVWMLLLIGLTGSAATASGQQVLVLGERTQVAVPAAVLAGVDRQAGATPQADQIRLTPSSVAISGNPGSLLWLGLPRSFEPLDGENAVASKAEAGELVVLAREELSRRVTGSPALRRALVLAEGEGVRLAVLAGEKVLASAAAAVVGRAGGDARRAPWLSAPMLVQRDNPELGWRVRLLLDAAGMGDLQPKKAGQPGVVRRAGEVLERSELGRLPLLQERDRFAYGLGRLAAADAALATEVAGRLLAVLMLPSEPLEGLSPARVRAPVFTADPAVDGAMVDAVAAANDDDQAIGLAKVWLARQPELLAVVTDDSGRLLDGTGGLRRPAMAIINAGGRDGVARLGYAGSRGNVMEPLAAFGSLVLRAEPLPEGTAEVLLRSLGTEQRHAVASTTALRPPGLRVERFVHELTAADLIGGQLRLSEPGEASVQLWFDRPRGKWLLAITLSAAAGGVRSVEVYGEQGPVGLGSVSKRVIERAAMNAAGDVLSIEVELAVGVVAAADGAAATAGRRVPLAMVVNRDGRGRLSWPRAMFPWQTEPGRAALDLSNWDGR